MDSSNRRTAPKIKLQSSDKQIIEVDEAVGRKMKIVSTLLKDMPNDPGPIPLMNVEAASLKLVIQWLEKHVDDPPHGEEDFDTKRAREIPPWDKSFLGALPDEKLFELMLAANYLDVEDLLEVACKTVAQSMVGKSADEIRERFGLENDMPEVAKAPAPAQSPASAQPQNPAQAQAPNQAQNPAPASAEASTPPSGPGGEQRDAKG